jgi:hypothetical protein
MSAWLTFAKSPLLAIKDSFDFLNRGSRGIIRNEMANQLRGNKISGCRMAG